MQTDHIERPTHHMDREILMEPEPSISFSHFTHVLRNYRLIIVLTIAGLMLAYMIFAVANYLFSPAQRVTLQPFRLDFEGAGKGEYPNKTRFNVADIVNGPILARVWQDNNLAEYLPFGGFSRSVYVLESNREFEQLAADYQARLADPKLNPIDRDRLQKEFELKTESIAKNEYTIYFSQPWRRRNIPDTIARKVLLDILNNWAEFAVNQQRVLAYQVSVLSPELLKPSTIEQSDAVAAIEVLRSKATRVINNVQKIEKLPGAMLARTPNDRQSLEEVRIRLDEILRFRLEPLLAAALHSPGLIADRAATTRFLESQLAYDQRQLQSVERNADAIREALAVYEGPAAAAAPLQVTSSKSSEPSKSSEAVVPQLSDSFLDRLLSLTGRASDAKYRQDLVDEYRIALAATVPLRQAVAYDTQVLDELHKPSGGGAGNLSAAAIQTQVRETRQEVGQLINKMNELFQIVSRNMTPSSQLFALTGPPSSRTLRGVSLSRLGLYGVLLFLLSIPAVIVLCLVHNRIREEETADEYLRQEHAAVP
jgi:hypothetical protein